MTKLVSINTETKYLTLYDDRRATHRALASALDAELIEEFAKILPKSFAYCQRGLRMTVQILIGDVQEKCA